MTYSFRFFQLLIFNNIHFTEVQSVHPNSPWLTARNLVALSENLRLLSGSDHHLGLLERVVAKPELPYDPPVVAIVLGFVHIFPIEIWLEAATRKNLNVSRRQTYNQPVEPPSSTVGGSTGTALWSSVIVPVHRGELGAVVGREAVTRVTGVTSHPDTIIRLLAVNSKKNI